LRTWFIPRQAADAATWWVVGNTVFISVKNPHKCGLSMESTTSLN